MELANGDRDVTAVPALMTHLGMQPKPPRRRISVGRPARELFPSLVHYEAHHSQYGLVGNIEASRGCHHKCTYCSVYGAYDGGIAAYDGDTVLADALQLAEEGVRHFIFIDAEFFNSRTIGVGVIERLIDEIGPITFEFTTRVDHVLSYPAELEKLVSLGLRRVTCALEFPSNRILRIFDKHIDVEHMRAAVLEAERMNFELIPTFIPFTPWIEYDELLSFEDFLIETGLARVTDPPPCRLVCCCSKARRCCHRPGWKTSPPWIAASTWSGRTPTSGSRSCGRNGGSTPKARARSAAASSADLNIDYGDN